MKIADARHIYGAQLRTYNEARYKIAERQNEIKDSIRFNPDNEVVYANEAARLELSYEALTKKQEEYQEYMNGVMERFNAQVNLVSSKNECKVAKKEAEDLGKIMEVARRIMKGATVPPYDEKKLMEYDDKLYQMAKNISMMAKEREREKYKSLWEDEEELEMEDPMEAADNVEISDFGPEIVSVDEVVASIDTEQAE